jgi:hypothetical protein
MEWFGYVITKDYSGVLKKTLENTPEGTQQLVSPRTVIGGRCRE